MEAQSDEYLRRRAAVFRARAGAARDGWAADRLNELANAFEGEAAREVELAQNAANDSAAGLVQAG